MTTLFSRALFAAGNELVRAVVDRDPRTCACQRFDDRGTCLVCKTSTGGITYACANASRKGDQRCGERVPEGEVFCRRCATEAHSQDSDCTLDANDQCVACGVDHSGTCPVCDGHGFHRAACALAEEAEQMDRVPARPDHYDCRGADGEAR
jgi:hypothetical protein